MPGRMGQGNCTWGVHEWVTGYRNMECFVSDVGILHRPHGGRKIDRCQRTNVRRVASRMVVEREGMKVEQSTDDARERKEQTDPGISFGSRKLRVFGGSSCPKLAADVARFLGLGKPSGLEVKRFADKEVYVKITESIRGCNVFLIQSTCEPVNDSLVELLLLIDASRRAHASQITVVIPYYGYARADRIVEKREALGSKLCANLITKAGADRVIIMDIHSPQSCGFFDIPLDHVHGSEPLLQYLRGLNVPLDDIVIVSPDVGGVKRARYFAKELKDAPLAIIDKRRPAANVSEVMNVIGDVNGKTAIVVDDMIDTAGTICNCCSVLQENGAKSVIAIATHALLSGPAPQRLANSGFQEVSIGFKAPGKNYELRD